MSDQDEQDYWAGEPVYGRRTPRRSDWLGLLVVAGAVFVVYVIIMALAG